MSAPERRKKRDPESEFWDTLKGKEIHIENVQGELANTTLRWVSRFTIGVDGGAYARPTMLFKHALAEVSLLDGK